MIPFIQKLGNVNDFIVIRSDSHQIICELIIMILCKTRLQLTVTGFAPYHQRSNFDQLDPKEDVIALNFDHIQFA